MGTKRARGGIAAIVFDLDGVIIDSEAVLRDTWAELYALHGASFSREEWCESVGTRDSGFDRYGSLEARADRPVPERTEIQAWIREREVPLVDERGPLPGVHTWIAAAADAGVPIAVATSSSRGWLESRLCGVGLTDSFMVSVTPDDGMAPKPAPDLYLAACNHLGVDPARALAIEDSVNGMNAALAAGMRCIAIPTSVTSWMDFSAAHLVARSLAELPFAETIASLSESVSE